MELAYLDLFDNKTKLVEMQESKKPVKIPSRINQLEARINQLEARLDSTDQDLDDVMERVGL